MRGPQLGRLARAAARSGGLRSFKTAAPAAAAQPALSSAAGLPASPSIERPGLGSLHPSSAGLTPQQAFAAHSLAQLGAAEGAAGAGVSAVHSSDGGGLSVSPYDVDEVALRLRQHLEAAFGAAAAGPPAGMCAPLRPPAPRPAADDASASLRSSAQAVAARLTKHAQAEVPHTLEGALQPSQQARLVVEAEPPFRLCWANPAWEALSGLEFADLGGQPCLELLAQHPSSAAAASSAAGTAASQLATLADALATHHRGSATLELALGGPQSCAAPVPVQVTATPLLGRDGSSTRMLLSFTPAHGVPTADLVPPS